ncbi:SDH family Clp fold serine proteinase [Niameybacter massiliensis]|uniref:SDH family Clp fold serine proteinase n=1 Tax=Niameybacter massiliensis TaxID=1658108 RepID=UPI0006B59AB5|nr:serine protease [Niameybacter massiliensis]
MPNWSQILEEIQKQPSKLDIVRHKYLERLSEYTGRNTIAYYSCFLNGLNDLNTSINDQDMCGFMNCLNGMDPSKGLDLILHTPGGNITATESIVAYLRSKFGDDIRAIIPQMAMSAGTMISLACKTIVMGKHSNLGPIDPQINGIPAYNIINEFQEAKEDLDKGVNVNYWSMQLNKYPPAFVIQCDNAIKLSSELVTGWLETGMFKDEYKVSTIQNIVNSLNENQNSKNHSRHYNVDFCKNLGLKIEDLEEDANLQDLVLSLHHAYTHTFSNTGCIKIIESNIGMPYIITQK